MLLTTDGGYFVLIEKVSKLSGQTWTTPKSPLLIVHFIGNPLAGIGMEVHSCKR